MKNQPPNVYGRHQIVCQKWKRIRKPNTSSEDIQLRYRDGMWHRKMCHVNNEKRKTVNDGRNRTTKSRKNQKRKFTSTEEYWKRTSSNEWRWENKF